MSIVIGDFYCDTCRRWTKVDPNESYPRCVVCGEEFVCGDCGYEIDFNGNCLRPEGHGDE